MKIINLKGSVKGNYDRTSSTAGDTPIRKVISIIVVSTIGISGTTAIADTLNIEYSFDRPVIQQIEIAGIIYDVVEFPELTNSGPPGHPALPVCGAEILIPYGHEIEQIQIRANEKIPLGHDLLIAPAVNVIPLSQHSSRDPSLVSDPEIYSSNLPYPNRRFEYVGFQSFRGYNVLILKLNPVEYIPAVGRLGYYPVLNVVVTTNDTRNISPLFRGHDNDRQEIYSRVDNPETAVSYMTGMKRGRQNYDMMIMTVPGLEDDFQVLKDYHDTTGVLTEIFTIVDVLIETGGGSADDIRDFIRMKYLSDGISYVLIGDDNNLIYSNIFGVAIPQNELDTTSFDYNMPADLFYGCLDGTFDYDGDGVYGEPTDGEGGGDVDLIAEVYVGRASVDNDLDVARFAANTIDYLSSSDPYLGKVLLCGERTYFPGPIKFGIYSLEELIDQCSTNGLSTVGIPSNLYDIGRLSDHDGLWMPSELIDSIRSGQHVINHVGHNAYDSALRLGLSHLDTLNGTDKFLVYSHGCFAGMFDTLDCWAEHVTVKTGGGAFAAIMNARMGWGSAFITLSPSQCYNREFWDAVFDLDENKPQIGRANQDSKEDNLFRINDAGMRYCYYQLNLFGDPSVAIKRPRAIAFDYPDGIPQVVLSGQPTPIQVVVSGLYEGEPVSGSGLLHYSVNDGDFQSTPMTEILPETYEVLLPAVECGDSMSFYFSVEEVSGVRISDVSPGAHHKVMPVIRVLTVFEDDFETDKGWNTSGLWERGIPTGGGGEYGSSDPAEGCAGPNVLGYNLDGDYENDLSAINVTSPVIDCSYYSNAHLTFQRWLGLGAPPGDSSSISLSTDGTNWIQIWGNDELFLGGEWVEMEFDISEITANEPTVYIRWTIGPTNSAACYCGWNIDNVKIVSYDCRGYFCGDANSDGQPNVGDAVFLINYVFKGGPAPDLLEAGDANCDGQVNIGDAVYLIAYVFNGGPMPCCP
jgi:hypothetical protein